MRIFLRRFSCTLLGSALTIVFSRLGALAAASRVTMIEHLGDFVLLAYIILTPLSFFVGSCLTGYLLRPKVEGRRLLGFLYSPGLLICLILTCLSVLMVCVPSLKGSILSVFDKLVIFPDLWMILSLFVMLDLLSICPVLWIVFSFLGVLTGYALRGSKQTVQKEYEY